MVASACDFMDDVIGALNVVTPQMKSGSPDNPGDAAEVAVAEIVRLQSCESALKKMREALRSMPGVDPFFHAPVAEADSLAERAINGPGEEEYEAAARAEGWEHGGDCGGFIYHKPTWGGWKAAASWSGDENGDIATIYDSWKECCDGEDIEVSAV